MATLKRMVGGGAGGGVEVDDEYLDSSGLGMATLKPRGGVDAGGVQPVGMATLKRMVGGGAGGGVEVDDEYLDSSGLGLNSVEVSNMDIYAVPADIEGNPAELQGSESVRTTGYLSLKQNKHETLRPNY
jgi:hypothetical protein